MRALLAIAVILGLLYACSGSDKDDDIYGLDTDHPTSEQLMRRQIDAQDAAIGNLEDCLKYMRGHSSGNEKGCPDE